jgi:hypothetical protein
MAFLEDRRTGGTNPAEVITTTLNGVTFQAGRRTAAHLVATDEWLRHNGMWLRVLQPCYNTGVSASSGTHDGDGVLDVEVVSAATWTHGQRLLRMLGWAAWYRPNTPGLWGDHIHAISLGCPGPVGALIPAQVDDYYAHRSGLVGHGADPSWHPGDIDSSIFDFPEWEADRMTPEDKAQLDRIEAHVAEIDKVLKRITKAKREVIAAVEDEK